MSAQERLPPCTCRPADNPPRPCPHRYALSECLAADRERRARKAEYDRNLKTRLKAAYNAALPEEERQPHQTSEELHRALTILQNRKRK